MVAAWTLINSPFQYVRKCIEKSMENMHVDVRVSEELFSALCSALLLQRWLSGYFRKLWNWFFFLQYLMAKRLCFSSSKEKGKLRVSFHTTNRIPNWLRDLSFSCCFVAQTPPCFSKHMEPRPHKIYNWLRRTGRNPAPHRRKQRWWKGVILWRKVQLREYLTKRVYRHAFYKRVPSPRWAGGGSYGSLEMWL